MSENPDLQWERVHNFGRVAHIVKDGTTFCGRDVSLNNKEIQKHPTKKCKRCAEFLRLIKIEPMIKVTA